MMLNQKRSLERQKDRQRGYRHQNTCRSDRNGRQFHGQPRHGFVPHVRERGERHDPQAGRGYQSQPDREACELNDVLVLLSQQCESGILKAQAQGPEYEAERLHHGEDGQRLDRSDRTAHEEREQGLHREVDERREGKREVEVRDPPVGHRLSPLPRGPSQNIAQGGRRQPPGDSGLDQNARG